MEIADRSDLYSARPLKEVRQVGNNKIQVHAIIDNTSELVYPFLFII